MPRTPIFPEEAGWTEPSIVPEARKLCASWMGSEQHSGPVPPARQLSRQPDNCLPNSCSMQWDRDIAMGSRRSGTAGFLLPCLPATSVGTRAEDDQFSFDQYTGVYGYPVEPAAEIAIRTVVAWLGERAEPLSVVKLVQYSEADHRFTGAWLNGCMKSMPALR